MTKRLQSRERGTMDLQTMVDNYAHVRRKSRGRRRPDAIKLMEAIDKQTKAENELDRAMRKWQEARRLVRYYDKKVSKLQTEPTEQNK